MAKTKQMWPCHHCGREHPIGPNPCHNPELTRTAIDVMRQGGKCIADEAYWKWHNGKYGDNAEQNRANTEKWKTVKALVDELCRGLLDDHKAQKG